MATFLAASIRISTMFTAGGMSLTVVPLDSGLPATGVKCMTYSRCPSPGVVFFAGVFFAGVFLVAGAAGGAAAAGCVHSSTGQRGVKRC